MPRRVSPGSAAVRHNLRLQDALDRRLEEIALLEAKLDAWCAAKDDAQREWVNARIADTNKVLRSVGQRRPGESGPDVGARLQRALIALRDGGIAAAAPFFDNPPKDKDQK
jgi:hypothetical protein